MTSDGHTPAPISWRPLDPADLPAVFRLKAAGEAFHDGMVETTMSEVEDGWNRPDFDPATMAIGAFLGGALVAYAEVFRGRVEATVHPDHRGEGLGASLAHWSWDVARSEWRERVGQTVSDNDRSAAALFEALGYERGHTAWVLRRSLTDLSEAPALPAGYAFRPYSSGEDDRAIYELIETAFAEWRNADSEPMGFENWVSYMVRGAAPDDVVLIERDGLLVGAAVGQGCAPGHEGGDEGWMDQVAVRRSDRGLGLGLALVLESFRRFRQAGRTTCSVSTDSRTGALDFYLRAGMTVERSYTRWVKTGLQVPGRS